MAHALLDRPRMRAWVIAAALGAACTEVHGRIDSSGGPLGDFVFQPDDCTDGEVRGFYGVSLTSGVGDDLRVRLVDDVLKGKVVVVEMPGFDSPGLEITPGQCRRFDFELGYDDCNGYSGHIDLDCDVPPPGAAQVGQNAPPGTLHGRVTFVNCN